jgi:hypothetical protein
MSQPSSEGKRAKNGIFTGNGTLEFILKDHVLFLGSGASEDKKRSSRYRGAVGFPS